MYLLNKARRAILWIVNKILRLWQMDFLLLASLALGTVIYFATMFLHVLNKTCRAILRIIDKIPRLRQMDFLLLALLTLDTAIYFEKLTYHQIFVRLPSLGACAALTRYNTDRMFIYHREEMHRHCFIFDLLLRSVALLTLIGLEKVSAHYRAGMLQLLLDFLCAYHTYM